VLVSGLVGLHRTQYHGFLQRIIEEDSFFKFSELISKIFLTESRD